MIIGMTWREFKQFEMKVGKKAVCFKCGNSVGHRGQIDPLWPYHEELNRCIPCLEKEGGNVYGQ